MQELSASLQGKQSAEVRTTIIERLGPAHRNIGSGFRIEQWDTPDGVLTFHPATGPSFNDHKSKRLFRLLRTTNSVRSNLLESYEMFTLPDPANHGTSFWLGNLKFGAEGTYRFIDSGQHRDHRSAQTENFFMLHPAGRVEIHYSPPVTADALLETLADGTTVAELAFTSADSKHRATFLITASESDRRLRFNAKKPISFYMDTSWRSFGDEARNAEPCATANCSACHAAPAGRPAAFAHPAPATFPQPARRAPQSLSLGSFGDIHRVPL